MNADFECWKRCATARPSRLASQDRAHQAVDRLAAAKCISRNTFPQALDEMSLSYRRANSGYMVDFWGAQGDAADEYVVPT